MGLAEQTKTVMNTNEPLDSRQLRAFASLANTGSFTRTGKDLSLTQSAISHAIKALEEDIACRLFDRVGKKVFLTQAGETLLHHSKKILAEMALARASIGHLGKWGRSRLRLGASTTACEHLLPPVLREFQRDFSKCAITISPDDTLQIVDKLIANQIDLAIALEPRRQDQIDFTPIFSDELLFAVAPQHPWAVAGQVVRAEIARQNYILYNKGSYTFGLIEHFFGEDAITLNTVVELGSMEAIKELVKLGLGVGIIAPWVCRKEVAERTLVLLPLGRARLRRNWGILHRRGHPLTLPEEAFIRYCRSSIAGCDMTPIATSSSASSA